MFCVYLQTAFHTQIVETVYRFIKLSILLNYNFIHVG